MVTFTDQVVIITEQSKTGLSEASLQEQLNDPSKSTMQRYQELALGTDSLWYLIKFELIMLFSSWMPGALGLALRKFLYPRILGTVGRGVVFGQGVSIRHGQKIHLADGVVLDDGAVLDAKGGSNTGISIGQGTIISRNVVLSCKNGNIKIGKGCTVGINSLIHAMEGSDVSIGDSVLIGAYCYFVGNGPYATEDLNLTFKQQGTLTQGSISVSDNVWFGSNVQILGGVKIGTGVIVGASAVVNTDVNDYDVVAGVPIKLIRNRQAS